MHFELLLQRQYWLQETSSLHCIILIHVILQVSSKNFDARHSLFTFILSGLIFIIFFLFVIDLSFDLSFLLYNVIALMQHLLK